MMDYNARFLNPGLGRFTQPDTIVPDPANPQGLNRYAYTLNNPVKFTDPTGHNPECDDDPDECLDENSDWKGDKCEDVELTMETLRCFLMGGMIMPSDLPSSITDPEMMLAWIYLYNTDQKWLAEVLLDPDYADIYVRWDELDSIGIADIDYDKCWIPFICDFGTITNATVEGIRIDYEKQGTNTPDLAGLLAHEIYHIFQPFSYIGAKTNDSQLEEYLARVTYESTVAELMGTTYNLPIENPFVPGALEDFFEGTYYERLQLFPPMFEN